MKWHASLILIMACALAPTGTAQDKVKVQFVDDPDKNYGIALPESWQIIQSPHRDESVMNLKVTLTGRQAGHRGRITIYWLRGLQIAETQPFFDKSAQLQIYGAETAEVGTFPLPFLQVPYRQGNRSQVALFIYRMIKGRGYSITANFDLAAFEAVREQLFEGAATFSTTLEPWPPLPEGYRESKRGHFKYYVHPSFTDNPGTIQGLVMKEEKYYTKIHGPLHVDEDWYPAFLLQAKGEGGLDSLPDYAPDDFDFWCENLEKRVYCCKTPSRKEPLETGLFMRQLYELFHTTRHGNLDPHWLCMGECELALERARTGKDLPLLSESRMNALPRTPLPFNEVATTLADRDYGSFAHHCVVYLALFRKGDKLYQDAYKKFMHDLCTFGDWEAATAYHLLSLDQKAMQEEAARVVSKVLRAKK
jgi:hypothetical protein